MRSRSPWIRRFFSGLLASSLLVGSTGSATAIAPSDAGADAASAGARITAATPVVVRHPMRATDARPDGGAPIVADATVPTLSSPTPGPVPEPKSPLRAKVESTVTVAPAATAAYRGRNHIWIPSLGVSRSLTWFSCSRTERPGHRLYQWGCAGRNNVYVFAHASSIFSELHRAYVNGRLHKGMRVIHADSKGRIKTYKVRYWKVVSPVGQSWAYAAQSRPSMTLQTCVGSRSQYRLVVRLLAG